MSLFLAEQSLPFTVALIVMLALSIIEGLSLLFGSSGLSATFDSAFDLDVDADVSAGPSPAGLLSWLHLGRVPVLMLLILFLTAFGIAGILIQIFFRSVFNHLLSAWIASVGAFLVAIPSVRFGGFLLEKILPKDESSAVTFNALVGRAGVIVIGTARVGFAAQARVRDQHGRMHHVMVEPDQENIAFEVGTEILLIKYLGTKYQAILNPHADLVQP
jgi:hypothetical protein